MQTFLREVAHTLYREYGDKIEDVVLVFPSRRARIYFLEALSEVCERPIWQPKTISLGDVVETLTGRRRAERLQLISELYKVYSQYHEDDFDKFYFWGEVLLADFEMVDNYLVDAEKLFANVGDIKELEADIEDYMTEEQLEVVRSFWLSLRSDRAESQEKGKFLKIWSSLAPIYKEFKERLDKAGIAYSGMMLRSVAERIARGEKLFDSTTRYAIIGFNALSKCEKKIFGAMQDAGVADFFWDYDKYYTEDKSQEAGLFLRDNVRQFKSKYNISCDNFAHNKQFTAVAAASNALQCKYAGEVIAQLAQEGKLDKDTAIVLTDENLIQPLIHSLPEVCEKINVTMGYPLRGSLAYSFVERIIELHAHSKQSAGGGVTFYHHDVVGLLTHPYVSPHIGGARKEIIDKIQKGRIISVAEAMLQEGEFLTALFKRSATWQELSAHLQSVLSMLCEFKSDSDQYKVEFLSYMHKYIVELESSIEMCSVDMPKSVYISLLRKQLQALRIPFDGEPLEGVQIMGILESRNVDFKNVIILSMGDDNFPGNHLMQTSYIPYSLRVGYSLPTPEHHEGVFGYYFYRLVQRAERVWMIYCSHADDKSTGEQSRYIRQIEYETNFPIKRVDVGVDVHFQPSESFEVRKEGEIVEQLMRFTREENPVAFSPTAIYKYIACPMRFYLHYIAGVRVANDMNDDVDSAMFGTILHAVMQNLYNGLLNIESPTVELGQLLKSKGVIESAVDEVIDEKFYRGASKGRQESGSVILVRDVIAKYVRTIINYDMNNPPSHFAAFEQEVQMQHTLPSGRRVLFGGVIDRIDSMQSGKLRVVDYKTGKVIIDFKSIDALFNGKGNERLSAIIQTFMYSVMLKNHSGRDTMPSLYYVRNMHSEDYSPLLIDKKCGCGVESIEDKCVDGQSYGELFMEQIDAKLEELFDTSTPFVQCEDKAETCLYCDFKAICRI